MQDKSFFVVHFKHNTSRHTNERLLFTEATLKCLRKYNTEENKKLPTVLPTKYNFKPHSSLHIVLIGSCRVVDIPDAKIKK